RRRITIPLTLSNLKLLRRITRTENILHRNFTRRQVAIQNRVASNIGISQSTFSVKVRPLLVMRSNLWASGYDVDGTDQTSLGQFSGRVQQTYKHSVPRFFVPEHGTMFTLALVRFPPT